MRLITLWAIDASNLGADAPSSATCHTQNLSVTYLSLYRNSSPTKDGEFSFGILYKGYIGWDAHSSPSRLDDDINYLLGGEG